MDDKTCPRCGHRISFFEFARIRTRRFRCRECGAQLGNETRRAMLAALVTAVPIALTAKWAMDDPVGWFGVGAALAFLFFVNYRLMRVVRMGDSASPAANG